MNVTAIIPAYNPDKKFHIVVEHLLQSGFEHVIIVDDGTEEKYENYFDKIKSNSKCVFLHHNKNLGKGRALKTAFNYFLDNFPEDIGVVTVDADNQHKVKDVLKCVDLLQSNPGSLVLGVRDFNKKDVPTKSSTGNKLTSFAFKAFCDLKISDTQTGLRAIPRSFVEILLDTSGERFEFETNMLLATRTYKVPILETEIETVYIDGNTRSNFNPLLDSFSIYKVILKYICSSFTSIICDYFLFVALGQIFEFLPAAWHLLIATWVARIISSTINFTLNKKLVFKNQSKVKATILKYYITVAINMTLSYLGILLLSEKLFIPTIIAKVFLDILLFLMNFRIQIKWVFK